MVAGWLDSTAVAGTQVRWTGHRLQSTEFHEIAEICKTGIRSCWDRHTIRAEHPAEI